MSFVELDERDVATDLGHIHVRVGPRSGPPILFWPSLLMDGRVFMAQAEYFSNRFQVVLVDPPGHGQSDPLHAPFDLATSVRVITQLLDDFGFDRVHHVGNSWGAMIGATLAATSPERLGAAVLLNGTASPVSARQRLAWAAVINAARVAGFRGPLRERLVDAFVGPTTKRDRPEVLATVRESVAGLDGASVAHAVRSSISHRRDHRELLGRITARTLVVAGAEDATFPVAETKAMADGIPNSEFVVLDDAAHLAALEVPDRVNALVDDFLARISA